MFQQKLLFWLEVLSVTKTISVASGLLRIAASVASELFDHAVPPRSQFIRGIVLQCNGRSAPHIYLSALPFACKDYLIWQCFGFRCSGVVSQSGKIHIWHTRSGLSLGAPFRCPLDVSSVVFSCDSSKVVTSTLSGTFEVRDIRSEQIISVHADNIPRQKYLHSLGNKFNWLARLPNEQFMAREAGSGSALEHKMQLWDVKMPGVVTTVQLTCVGAGAAFSTDSRSLVIGGRDRIMAWQVEAIIALAARPRCDPLVQLLREGVPEDGWVLRSSGELLLWIPAAYRDYLPLPPCTLMIGKHRVIFSADATGLHYGTDWTSCWRQAGRSELQPKQPLPIRITLHSYVVPFRFKRITINRDIMSAKIVGIRGRSSFGFAWLPLDISMVNLRLQYWLSIIFIFILQVTVACNST